METKQKSESILEMLDFYSIFRDVLRNLWVIILGAIAVCLVVSMVNRSKYESTYSTTATFVVTSRTSGSYAYGNLNAASTMANSYSNILNSNLLKKKVCEDLGVDSFNAKMATSIVKGTNLITLTVTSDSPWNTYCITRSVMDNVTKLTGYVSSDMVMEVLQPPAVPTHEDGSYNSRRQIKIALAASLAVLTLAFVFLSIRKDTIKSEKDIEEKLEAHSLGVLYHDGKVKLRNLFKITKKQKKKKQKLLVSEVTASFEFVERNKKIAAMVATQAKNIGAKVILVTSFMEHEGKSTVSANIALSLAQQSHDVLLIDGDMRRPTLNTLFLDDTEGSDETSVAKLLMGETSLKKAMRYDEKRGVYLLLNYRNYPNSTDIVSKDTTAQLINVARNTFEYIIIDTPPMSLMADAEVLAAQADMSILVVNYDMVYAQDLNDAIDSLKDCRAQFAGCILNQVRTLPGERRAVVGQGGYGRYGNYSRYGKYGKYGRYGRYGRYGNYGNYGAYGYYGHYAEQQADQPTDDEAGE